MGKKTVSIAAIALLGLIGLTGCASDDAAEAPAETAAETQAMENEQPAESTAEESDAAGADSISTGGDFSLTVDGEAVEIDNAVTACASSNGKFALSISSTNADAGLGAVLSSEENPTVESVSLVDLDGKALGYVQGAYGSADVKVDGKTYTITGTAASTDMQDTSSVEEVPFEFVVTCN